MSRTGRPICFTLDKFVAEDLRKCSCGAHDTFNRNKSWINRRMPCVSGCVAELYHISLIINVGFHDHRCVQCEFSALNQNKQPPSLIKHYLKVTREEIRFTEKVQYVVRFYSLLSPSSVSRYPASYSDRRPNKTHRHLEYNYLPRSGNRWLGKKNWRSEDKLKALRRAGTK